MQTGASEKSKSQTPQKTLGFLSRQLLFNSSNNIFKAHFSSPPLSSGLFIMIFVNFITQKKINCPLNVLGQERSVSICFNRIFFCQWAFGGSFSSINMSGAHSNPVVNGGGGGTFLEGQQAGAKK